MLSHLRSPSLVVMALSVLVLSACGGGGSPSNLNGGTGNGGTGNNGDSSIVQDSAPTSRAPTNLTTPTPAILDRIARTAPTAGSVTQGSNVEDGVTTDRVSIRFIPDDPGINTYELPHHPIVTIRTGDGRTLESNTDPTRMRVVFESSGQSSGEAGYINPARDDLYGENINHSFPQNINLLFGFLNIYYSEDFEKRYRTEHGSFSYPGTDEATAEFERARNQISLKNYIEHPKQGRRIDSFFVADQDGGLFVFNEDGNTVAVTGNPRGMGVFGFTDYPSSQEGANPGTDYVSWGFWAYYQVNNNTLSDMDLGYGAFADGIETTFGNIPLTGTASYSGYSSGMVIKGEASDLETAYTNSFEFIAEANLTADLSTATIEGTVGNFKGTNWDAGTSPDIIAEALANDGFLADLTITLGRADITERSSHSFFQGDARATGLSEATGKWGGQFFGTPGAGEAPPAVGGTWGVTQGTGPNDWKMIGGYGAWKNP